MFITGIYFSVLLVSCLLILNPPLAASKNKYKSTELSKLIDLFLKALKSYDNDFNDEKTLDTRQHQWDANGIQTKTIQNIDKKNFESCGVSYSTATLDKRIVGGHPAKPHSWPWQVRLLKRSSTFRDVCGGTIISHDHVITAAHCVWSLGTGKKESHLNYMIVAGDHDRSTDADDVTQNISVNLISVYPHYNKTSPVNDLAILTLAIPLEFNENVSSCCLSREEPVDGKPCYATGWGSTGRASDQTDVLMQVRLPLFTTRTCRSKFYGELIADKMLCAGYEEGEKDTCQGDSGGPLVCRMGKKWTLEGVTSWGDGCALPLKPGVYTKVSSYIDWIKVVSGISGI